MILKPKYSPGEKIELISGWTWWVNYLCIFHDYITYNIWDGRDKFLSMDEWQIKGSLEDVPKIWFEVEVRQPRLTK